MLQSWSTAPSETDPVGVIDAAEYAGLAAEKWEASRQRGRVIDHFRDLHGRLRKDSKGEMVFLIVASLPQGPAAGILGFCLFRRTWAHNLFVDYLGTSPASLRPGAQPVRGVGTGLLYTVMAVGHEMDAGRCMLEATDVSFGFYRHQFRLMEVNDLCSLSAAEQWHFMEKTRASWERGGMDDPLDLDPKTL